MPRPPTNADLTQELRRLLGLQHAPVGVTIHDDEPLSGRGARPDPQPAGCCFWPEAEQQALLTVAEDHAHCSVGSYTHGFFSLEAAAAGEDTAALVDSGWVTGDDLAAVARLPAAPAAILYQPLTEAEAPDVVLLRLTPASLMSLQGACPELAIVTRLQCQIVPLAAAGAAVVSPGCAVSRVRSGLPSGELTCALPARGLEDVVIRLRQSLAADAAVGAYAEADLEEHFRPA